MDGPVGRTGMGRAGGPGVLLPGVSAGGRGRVLEGIESDFTRTAELTIV